MSKKRSAIIALFFLTLLTFTACHTKKTEKDENQKFETYTHTLFCQEVGGNSISLHYTLKNPDAYGVKVSKPSLGTVSSDPSSTCAALENARAFLSTFHPNRLSDDNQLTYDILCAYFDMELSLAPYALYEEPLSPLTGIQAQLPVILSEYPFHSENDVDTYLELLKQVPAYFDSVLELEQKRADAGFFMSDDALNNLLEECRSFVAMGKEHYLYSTFDERIQELDAELKTSRSQSTNVSNAAALNLKSYQARNDTYLQKYVFPAYRSLELGLLKIQKNSQAKDGGGLCHLPQGKTYYELLVKRETGSDRNIADLKELTKQQISLDLTSLQKAIQDSSALNIEENGADTSSSDLFSSQGILLDDSNPQAILTLLQKKIAPSFPKPPSVNVQIKYVSDSMEDYLSPAFYMIPALDDYENNVIYINSGQMPDDMTLFTTLAHEGYPGHLYQNVYYMSTKPDSIRCLLDFGGYTEGWATYSEMLSYYYAPIAKTDACILQKNTSLILGLYALTDIGIHYDGWSLSDTIRFFRQYGIVDAEAIGHIYELIVQDPANYLKYYIGYLEFLELKKEAIEQWGDDFTQMRFHKRIMDTGPAPFEILRKELFRK